MTRPHAPVTGRHRQAAGAPDAPGWLAALAARRGQGGLHLIRTGEAQVWAGSHLVAKVPGTDPSSEGAAAAAAHRAGVNVPAWHGTDRHAHLSVTWWQRIPGPHLDDPLSVAQVLRRLHDTAEPGGLPTSRLAQYRPGLVSLLMVMAGWSRATGSSGRQR